MNLVLDLREYNRKKYTEYYELVELKLNSLRYFKDELPRVYCKITGDCAKTIDLNDDCIVEHITQNYIHCIMFENQSKLCRDKRLLIEKVLGIKKEDYAKFKIVEDD